jgi:hypothetical protein
MREMRTNGIEAFPRYGARARVWGRFERDLWEWLETPEGRFARWGPRSSSPAPPPGRATRTDPTGRAAPALALRR